MPDVIGIISMLIRSQNVNGTEFGMENVAI